MTERNVTVDDDVSSIFTLFISPIHKLPRLQLFRNEGVTTVILQLVSYKFISELSTRRCIRNLLFTVTSIESAQLIAAKCGKLVSSITYVACNPFWIKIISWTLMLVRRLKKITHKQSNNTNLFFQLLIHLNRQQVTLFFSKERMGRWNFFINEQNAKQYIFQFLFFSFTNNRPKITSKELFCVNEMIYLIWMSSSLISNFVNSIRIYAQLTLTKNSVSNESLD